MVKTTKGAILGYKPEPPPADLPASAQRYLDTELHRVSAVLQNVLALLTVIKSPQVFALEPMSEPPPVPTMPWIVYTDGATWDPGSGEGYYYFNSNGVWTPLG